jgi:predicted RNA-binding Zn-ribbon protein involved in translation (DUF1610 family)
MNEFDFNHAYEVCPYCDTEVMLDAELKVQTCPNCGKRIVTCSMCRATDCGDGIDYCSRCCLCAQARLENKEIEEKRDAILSHQFAEVRCDYFDELDKIWLVDAWRTPDDDEGGFVVAKINPETLEVTYNDPVYAKDKLVKEQVAWRLKEILKDF